jgi:hypothetical protein
LENNWSKIFERFTEGTTTNQWHRKGNQKSMGQPKVETRTSLALDSFQFWGNMPNEEYYFLAEYGETALVLYI